MIFSVLAFCAVCISICIKDRKKSLYVQGLNCLFESIYAFTINAFTAAVLSLVNVVRTFIFIQKDKFSKIIYLLVLLFFEAIIVVNCIFTWNGYISLLPTIGSMIRSYCLWQSNMKLVRLSGMTSGIFYGLYYIYYRSWFMVLAFVVLIITSLMAIYENDVKKENK